MPKITAPGGLRKISLGQIIDAGNIRRNYTDIEELAESIKTTGQLEPVLVKAHGKNEDGIDEFELIAGHRRYRAFQHLCAQGDSFTVIDAMVIAGDKLTIQLVENLQRTDLTAQERETGIYQMCQNGLSQTEAAARLAKTKTYISRNVSAHKIRESAERAGINTAHLATATLNEIQGAEEKDFPGLVQEIIAKGGTSSCARSIMEQYRSLQNQSKEREAPPLPSLPGELETDAESYDEEDTEPEAGTEREEAMGKNETELPPAVETMPPPQAASKKPAPVQSSARKLNDFDPPHKNVDINEVLVIIKDYIEKIEELLAGSEVNHKRDAAWDIIALLHEKL